MKDYSTKERSSEMDSLRLFTYWFDTNRRNAILNNVNMRSFFVLSGPNGGGKSSMLCSLCTAALLGSCGLMMPSDATPHFNSIMPRPVIAELMGEVRFGCQFCSFHFFFVKYVSCIPKNTFSTLSYNVQIFWIMESSLIKNSSLMLSNLGIELS
ncbi:DNA mismatch repair protein mutS [Hordeum vulgare]|nr:DNA mismatch repair protein mutS [Hordeum vulgare]